MASEGSRPAEPFGREEGRTVFGLAAASYAEGRPGYPERVYEVLRDRCGLGPTSRVVEIGPGTGQATERVIASGATVTAVEPSEELASLLRARIARVDAVVSTFEDAKLSMGSCDLVVSATAFHWVDPDVALPKIAAILRPGGWLALWWNVFGDPDEPDAFHDATEPVLRDLTPGPSSGSGGVRHALDVDARIGELTRGGFRDVEHEIVRWTLRLDPPQTRALYASFSNVARVPDPERERILDELERIARVEFGGRVERRMLTPIYTAHT